MNVNNITTIIKKMDTEVSSIVVVTDIVTKLYTYGIAIIACLIMAEVFKRMKQSEILGQVLVGILLGPYVLGVIHPSEIWDFLSELGALTLLFITGLETNIKEVMKSGLAASILAICGVTFSFFLVFPIVYLLTRSFILALYIGAMLCATSVGITARVFAEFGRLKSIEAQTIIVSAVLDDILTVFLLILATNFAVVGTVSPEFLVNLFWSLVVFLLSMLGLSVLFTSYVVPQLRKLKARGAVLYFSFGFALLSAVASARVGLSPIIGAYIAGVMLSEAGMRDEILRDISPIAHITVPVFLLNIGLRINIYLIAEAFVLGLVFSAIAIIAKVLSGFPAGKIQKLGKRSSVILGVGMAPRGEVGLIFASIGLSMGILNDMWYATTVFVVLVSTFLTPIALRYLLAGGESSSEGST